MRIISEWSFAVDLNERVISVFLSFKRVLAAGPLGSTEYRMRESSGPKVYSGDLKLEKKTILFSTRCLLLNDKIGQDSWLVKIVFDHK